MDEPRPGKTTFVIMVSPLPVTKIHPLDVQGKFYPAKDEIQPAATAPLIYISPPLVPCHLTSLLSDKRLVRSSSAWRRPQRPSVAEIFQFFVFTDRRKIRWSFVTGVESEQRAEGRAGHGGGAGLTGRGSQDRLLSLNRRSTL
ncbi:hypothetical protein MJG53_014776 [Ovis ammon polii x Ovis aries]|uniref:Uncharacterized protein n=1 Tax=Ovis ammon polii x Ovis aries TaxID=2918886 RepID=A0ACB9UDJ2_9CETA|nr:hypothetical protein MJG53_014776 [Ovis ammon polii x Ovis aries]